MNRILLLLSLVSLVAVQSFGQLNGTFSNGSGFQSVAVGTGGTTWNIGTIPSGWTQVSVDGLTPYTSLQNVFSTTKGWVLRALTYSDGTKDTVAASTSWYTPAGVANDWLITPAVAIPSGSGYYLTWDAVATNSTYPDGYKVLVGTSSNYASFTSAPILTVAAEQSGVWNKRAINMSAYAGQTVYIAFVNNSDDKELLYLNNVAVKQFTSSDVRLSSLSIPRYAKTNANVDIKGTVVNKGVPVTSLEIKWNDGSGAQTANLTGLNIAPYGIYSFTHSIPFNKATTNEYSIVVEVSKVNGVADAVITDNNDTTMISTIANSAPKSVLIEEGTGTWCGYCPRGACAMAAMDANHPSDFVGIAVHNGDPMMDTVYNNRADFSGFPGANVDRVMLGEDVSATNFESYYQTRKAVACPVDLSQSFYTVSGNNITASAKATFKTKISTDVRLAAVVVEDNVKGTAAGYNQTNYYANNALGAMCGYEALPNPVPASQMSYDHVGRKLLGGYDGQAGSVTLPTADGSNASYTFNYTVPASSVVANTHIVILAIDQSTGEVLNAQKLMSPQAIKVANNEDINLNIYPSPSNGSNQLNVEFSMDSKEILHLNLYSISGALVKSLEFNSQIGNNSKTINIDDLATGQYTLSISSSKSSYTKMITISK